MDLLCNVPTCRIPLVSTLWVTSCSHSFCEEHARSLAHKNTKCPACSTILGKRFDVIRQNSNPTEDFRSMLLVGLRPEIVLDVAMRAISFWNYQVDQELKYQSNSARRLKEAVEKVKGIHTATVRQLANAKKTCDGHEKQVGDLKNTIKILREQIAAKDHQLQKLQHLFNSKKDKANLRPMGQNGEGNFHATQFMDSFPRNECHNNRNKTTTDKNSEFIFEPQLLAKKNDV